MARPLAEYFGRVDAADIESFGYGRVADYMWGPVTCEPDWTITNPPFSLAEQFTLRAIRTSRIGVAMFVRTSFLEGTGRYARLFNLHKPKAVLQFTERVPLVKGRCDAKASTATAYCWVVWAHGRAGWPTEFHWIAPCRKRLERDDDYDQGAGQ